MEYFVLVMIILVLAYLLWHAPLPATNIITASRPHTLVRPAQARLAARQQKIGHNE